MTYALNSLNNSINNSCPFRIDLYSKYSFGECMLQTVASPSKYGTNLSSLAFVSFA